MLGKAISIAMALDCYLFRGRDHIIFLFWLLWLEDGLRMDVFEPFVQSLKRLLVICFLVWLLLILFHSHDGSQQIVLPFQSESYQFYSYFAM